MSELVGPITSVTPEGFTYAVPGGARFAVVAVELDRVDQWETLENGDIVCRMLNGETVVGTDTITTAEQEAAVDVTEDRTYIPPVPAFVKAWRFRAVAEIHGLTDGILALIEGMDEPLRTVANSAFHGDSEFERNNPTLRAMADALNITSNQLDQYFREAAAITL